MVEPRSFADILASTAKQKLAAAHARRNPNSTAEKPRDAIIQGLQIVGGAIAEDGYVFSPSGMKYVRKCGDFSFHIEIQSDQNNIAGQRAAIWVHPSVYSRTFNAWKKKHPSDWIRPATPVPLPLFINQLGYLCDPADWTEWDFSDPSQRRHVAEDLVASIQKGAFPLFSLFEAGAHEIASLTERDWPTPEQVLGYLLATGHASLAGESLQQFLYQRPAFREKFEQLYQEFLREGIPEYRGQDAHNLAAFAVATGYPWND